MSELKSVKKSRFVVFIIVSISFLFSCGAVRKEIQPKYQFEIGKTYHYLLTGYMNLAIDAGLLKYNGKAEFSADLDIKAIEITPQGYKLNIDIKNADVKGIEGFLTTAFYMMLNEIRNWFATIYLTESGNSSVYYKDKPVVAFNTIAQALFPDFSDMESLWKNSESMTNFPARNKNQLYTVVYKNSRGIKNVGIDHCVIQDQMQFITYDQEDFVKSVEPQSVGTINLTLTDIFNLIRGQLNQKNGIIDVSIMMPIKESIFTYIISVKGDGQLQIVLDEKII